MAGFDFNAGRKADEEEEQTPPPGAFDFEAGASEPPPPTRVPERGAVPPSFVGPPPLEEGPSLLRRGLDKAEAFTANAANVVALHGLPAATGYTQAGADWLQDKVGPGRISDAIQWMQETSLGEEGARQLEGQGQQAYEDERRRYFADLAEREAFASGAGEVFGTGVGAVATPGLGLVKGAGIGRNALRMAGDVGIDAAMSGADMYGQTGNAGQALEATGTGGVISAVTHPLGRVAGAGLRGAGRLMQGGGKLLGLGGDMARRGADGAGPQQLRQEVNDVFDQLKDPELLAERANEANAAAAGMRLQTHRRRINELPGQITEVTPGSIETRTEHALERVGDFDPEVFQSLSGHEALDYASRHLPELGEGYSRRALGMGDNKVLKILTDPNPESISAMQNKHEADFFRSVGQQHLPKVPNVLEEGPGSSWMVVDRAKPFDSGDEMDAFLGGRGQSDLLNDALYYSKYADNQPVTQQQLDEIVGRMTPQSRQAYEELRGLRDATGLEDFKRENLGLSQQDQRLQMLDPGSMDDRARPAIRDLPYPRDVTDVIPPRVLRGPGGVQGYGQDLERLGLTLPNLPATSKRAGQIAEVAGKKRGDIITQVEDAPVDRRLVADALLKRANEVSRLYGQSNKIERYKTEAERIMGPDMEGSTARELWKSIQSNADNVDRNSAPADVEFFGDLEDAMNAALDRHVFERGGQETFEAWKRAGRDYQVAKTARDQADDMIERGMTNRGLSLTNTIAMAGGMAAGGPLGMLTGAAAAAANQGIRMREKPWTAQFFRHARDRAREGNPLAEQEIEAVRQAALRGLDASQAITGALGSGARGLGAGLDAAGRATHATGRGLGAATPTLARAGLLLEGERPPTPEEQQVQRVTPRESSYQRQIQVLQELQDEGVEDEDLDQKYSERLQQELLRNPKALQQYMR